MPEFYLFNKSSLSLYHHYADAKWTIETKNNLLWNWVLVVVYFGPNLE